MRTRTRCGPRLRVPGCSRPNTAQGGAPAPPTGRTRRPGRPPPRSRRRGNLGRSACPGAQGPRSVPQPHRLVVAGGGEQVPVRAKRNPFEPRGVWPVRMRPGGRVLVLLAGGRHRPGLPLAVAPVHLPGQPYSPGAGCGRRRRAGGCCRRLPCRMSPAAVPASRIALIAPSSSVRVWARAISPASIMASSVPVMPCLVASQLANRSIHRRMASAGVSWWRRSRAAPNGRSSPSPTKPAHWSKPSAAPTSPGWPDGSPPPPSTCSWSPWPPAPLATTGRSPRPHDSPAAPAGPASAGPAGGPAPGPAREQRYRVIRHRGPPSPGIWPMQRIVLGLLAIGPSRRLSRHREGRRP